jgi:chromosome segregation ATPase
MSASAVAAHGAPAASPCCSSCAGGGTGPGSQFSSHLQQCLRNLESDYDTLRVERDQLAAELEDMKRINLERAHVMDSLHRLGLEVQQLRVENTEFRERELALKSAARDRVSRAEYDAVLEQVRQLTDKAGDAEQQQRFFADLSLRAAKLQSEHQALKSDSDALRGDHARLSRDNAAMTAELTELRKAHADLQAQAQVSAAEAASLRGARDSNNSLVESVASLNDKLRTANAELEQLRGRVGAQQNLVDLLTKELGDRSAAKADYDRMARALEAAKAAADAAGAERAALERSLREKADEQARAAQRGGDAEGSLRAQLTLLERERSLLASEAEQLRARDAAAGETTRALTAKLEDMTRQLADATRAGMRGSSDLSRATEERDEQVRQLRAALDRVARLEEELRSKSGASGLTAAELERRVAALKKYLAVEQLGNKKLQAELGDVRLERDAAVGGYRKLQGRFQALAEDKKKVDEELFGLRVDAAGLAGLRRAEQDAQQRAAALAQQLATAENEGRRLAGQLQHAQQSLGELDDKLRGGSNALVNENGKLVTEVDRLGRDLAALMTSYDKCKALADHYKAKYEELVNASLATDAEGHVCAKGRRCPCKSRPPPPSRWKN